MTAAEIRQAFIDFLVEILGNWSFGNFMGKKPSSGLGTLTCKP
jgi:hypothetical protein